MKILYCRMCGLSMRVSKHSSRKICDSCRPEYNRIKAREHYRRYILTKNINIYRKRARDRLYIKYEKDPRLRLLVYARNRARARQVPFNLSHEDIIIPDRCPVLKRTFEKSGEYRMSIDSIIPNKGYISGNIQIISMKANAMKNSATPEELREFANWVLTTVVRTPDVPEI